MLVTAHDLFSLLNSSNFAHKFEVDLSIARTAMPIGLILPSRSKTNGLLVRSKGTGLFTLSFEFQVKGSTIGLTETSYHSSELVDNMILPYNFVDLIFTNDAQPGVVYPVLEWVFYIDG